MQPLQRRFQEVASSIRLDARKICPEEHRKMTKGVIDLPMIVGSGGGTGGVAAKTNHASSLAQVSVVIKSEEPGVTWRRLMSVWNNAESRLHTGAMSGLIDFGQVSGVTVSFFRSLTVVRPFLGRL